MQQRRLRPGDVLDDYCPRERRVTDHAIVAMIEDEIQQTRCVVCDAEHEYKQAKVPPQRKKKTPALFTQVLDGLKAPARPPHVPEPHEDEPDAINGEEDDDLQDLPELVALAPDAGANGNGAGNGTTVNAESSELDLALAAPAESTDEDEGEPQPPHVDGPFRRQLIRAALPRPEGTPPPARVIPEFTIRQPGGRPNRHGGRRRGQQQGQAGPMRFGRSGGGQGQRSNGHGRSGGQGGQGGHGGHGFGGGQNGNRAGSRRGGKKR